MGIDFKTETERLGEATAGVTGAVPLAGFQPLAAASPLGALRPAIAAAGFSGGYLGNDITAVLQAIRHRSAAEIILAAPLTSFFRAWSVQGRRSALGVIRDAFLKIHGREPLLDELDSYLTGVLEARLNAGEVRYLIAAHAGLSEPKRVLNARQMALKVVGAGWRRVFGARLVPFRFSSQSLALDALMLDVARLSITLTTAPKPG